MAKKQTRRSISVSGDTYNAVRDYCDEHGLSASGLVTDLLAQYLQDNAGGPPAQPQPSPAAPVQAAAASPKSLQEPRAEAAAPAVKLNSPQPLRDANYPDRRGPGFSAMSNKEEIPMWRVISHLEIARNRKIDAQSAVEILMQNLVHRRMVNTAEVVEVKTIKDKK